MGTVEELASGHGTWAQVDNTGDPGWFVRFLDRSRARSLAAAATYPDHFFAHLNVQQGHHVLDIGCGTGDLLHPLARLVGPRGRVVGVDSSRVMISEAQRRAAHTELPLEFTIGDVHRLDFAADSFDRCLSTAVLQHVTNPGLAVSEMARVTRPGGMIVALEQDWETQVIDASDHGLTRRILNFFCDSIPNGWIGRQLSGLFRKVDLTGVSVTPLTYAFTDYEVADSSLGLSATVKQAQERGVLTSDEATSWLADLQERSRAHQFFCAFTVFRAIGHKVADSGQ